MEAKHKDAKMNKRQCHIYLGGNSLENLSDQQVQTYLDECAVVKPIHVKQNLEESKFALLHFANEADAATFRFIYESRVGNICRRLADVAVKPSFASGTREHNMDKLMKESALGEKNKSFG